MQGVDAYIEQSKARPLDDIIRDHSLLVVKIAKKIKRRLPSHIDINDLMQSGFIGLIEANKLFKHDQGATFETYAAIKIKGAMLDELRRGSWNDREAIKNIKELGVAVNKVEQRTQDKATHEAIAKEMNLSIEQFDKICQRINLYNVVNIETLDEMNMSLVGNDEPESNVVTDNLKDRIKSLLDTLPEREQLVLSLYYNEELTLKEISGIMQLTEARVCQIHASTLAKLKMRLGK